MNGVFIVGTDTGVGKTVVSAALVAALRAKGRNAGYMKPVGSDGVDIQGRLVSPDALFVARAAALHAHWALTSPVCLPGALSPLAAAEAAGVEVDLSPILPAWRELTLEHDFLVVEGVGGLLVPIAPGVLATELLSTFGLPVLIVGRPGLGTINHTLLTVEALTSRGTRVLGFCYANQTGGLDDASRATNARHTELFTAVPFLGALPFVPDLEPPRTADLAAAGTALAEEVLNRVGEPGSE